MWGLLVRGVAVALVSLALGGCATGPNVAGDWKLAGATGHELFTTDVTLTNDGSDVSVAMGCNSMSGTARLRAFTFAVTNQSATEMGCEPYAEWVAHEEWLSGFLAQPSEVTFPTPDVMELRQADVVLRFTRT